MYAGEMSMEAGAAQIEYEKYAQKRDALTEAIINSDACKKLIVAGPGTGKSYLFQQICKRSAEEGEAKILALSFINT
jgi:chromosomal replication initiation ATPase DnaA